MDEREIGTLLVDAICETPLAFSLGSVRLCLYPPTLGVHLLSMRLWGALGVDESVLSIRPEAEALRLSSQERAGVLRLVALHTLRGHRAADSRLLERRCRLLSRHCDTVDLSRLLLALLMPDGYDSLLGYYGLDREQAERQRLARAKSPATMRHFGGRTLWGGILDYAMARYGWTMQYCLWGISYLNLRMLSQDASASVYLSEEERKRQGEAVIDADDPKNRELIRQILSD